MFLLPWSLIKEDDLIFSGRVYQNVVPQAPPQRVSILAQRALRYTAQCTMLSLSFQPCGLGTRN